MINHESMIHRVRRILLKKWDPIGVGDVQEVQDEYDMYLPEVFEIIMKGGSIEEIFDYLRWVEEIRIGLPIDEARTRCVAEMLFKLNG